MKENNAGPDIEGKKKQQRGGREGGRWGRGDGGGVLISGTAVVSRPYGRPLHPYNAGTEHVGFSPTRQALLAPSTKRREAFHESHEG